ncbi:rCG28924, isoform CRA_a [Rattus norvegicus]|uniref:RCG28924, isoform CRA_a n=1 Tax=Rattus norvegicus TaxID=10116 RepID=A6HVC2_RAT|nr:rCG28924, isoform CRA_a [Rattus norvegicus]EDL82059.1 rCG28924, isoform CRA_a [Rattus norvegicus]
MTRVRMKQSKYQGKRWVITRIGNRTAIWKIWAGSNRAQLWSLL